MVSQRICFTRILRPALLLGRSLAGGYPLTPHPPLPQIRVELDQVGKSIRPNLRERGSQFFGRGVFASLADSSLADSSLADSSLAGSSLAGSSLVAFSLRLSNAPCIDLLFHLSPKPLLAGPVLTVADMTNVTIVTTLPERLIKLVGVYR